MGFKLGLNAKAYYAAANLTAVYTGTAVSWVELTIIKNVNLPLTKEQFDISTRGDGGWKASVGTLLSGDVSFDVRYDPADAGYLAMLTAALPPAGVQIAMAFMDGPIATTGSRGLVANFSMVDFPISQNITEALMTAGKVSISTFPTWFVKS